MSAFKDLLDLCRAQSIAHALYGDEDATWRYICRKYSQTFHTPLHIVKQLDPEEVILEFFSHQLDGAHVEDQIETILEQIYALEDPAYSKALESELDDFMAQAEREEEERLAKGKAIHPGIKNEPTLAPPPKNTSEEEPQPEEDLPTGGFFDMSKLDPENET